jgi:hypothetical protein
MYVMPGKAVLATSATGNSKGLSTYPSIAAGFSDTAKFTSNVATGRELLSPLMLLILVGTVSVSLNV